MFDIDMPGRSDGGFGFAAPPIDLSEDDKAYKLCAELPGLDAKDVDASVSGDMLVLKGEKHQEQEQKDKNYHSPNAPMARSGAASNCQRVSTAARSLPIFRRGC